MLSTANSGCGLRLKTGTEGGGYVDYLTSVIIGFSSFPWRFFLG